MPPSKQCSDAFKQAESTNNICKHCGGRKGRKEAMACNICGYTICIACWTAYGYADELKRTGKVSHKRNVN